MKKLLPIALLLGLVAGTCDETTTTCPCDCPNGPPPVGQISQFCLDSKHNGEVCCLGPGLPDAGPVVGKCQGLECVP